MAPGSNKQQTSFEREIAALLLELGIPEDYGIQHQLGPCEECSQLQSIGTDMFGRDQSMSPQAALAFAEMKAAAADYGVELQAVSAYRSVKYQAGIIKRKLAAGQSIAQILQVSAAPGYSEHHSGRALDLSTPGYAPLEKEFEDSPAFAWLKNSATDFGFKLSYPRNNPHGVCYEPWHWCWAAEV